MSKKINPTSIGLFIVAGVALGVAGVLVFGSWKLFSKTREVIVYFDESLNGLNEGAPVKYRGVTIGSVKRVMVRFNQATNDFAMPVILEFEEELIRRRLGDTSDIFEPGAMERRVDRGLRASLQTESLVTGVLYVDVRPNTNAAHAIFHQLKPVYPEIPTEATQIQQLFDNLASVDVRGIGTNLNALLVKLDTSLSQLQIGKINEGLTNLLVSLDRLASSPDLTNSLSAIRPTLDQFRLLAEKVTGRIDPVADSLTNSLAEASRALAEVRGAADSLRSMVSPDAGLRHDLDILFQQLGAASQSLSSLLDFLRQHPNALITGRERQGKNQ